MSGYDEQEELILRTYNSVWKGERKLYSIEGIKLLFPVTMNEILYFVLSIGISILLVKIVPFYNKLHIFIKFGAVPFALMKFFTKQKLDGKLPHKFFIDYILYLVSPKKYIRFAPIEEINKAIFSSVIVYRIFKVVDKTEIVLNKVNKKRGE